MWRAGALRRDDAARPGGPFVGRRAELAQFPALLETIKASGTGRAVLVRGEPGIGKSRLIEEFESIATAAGFACHKSLVFDFGVGKGQDAIRRLVRSLLDMPSVSGKEARLEAAGQALRTGMLGRDREVFLNNLMDLDQAVETRALYDAMDNATRNRGKQDTVAELVRVVSQRNPLLLAVEDVHWADGVMLGYFAALARAASGTRLIVVMTTRIAGDPIDEAWRGSTGETPLLTIDLTPLRSAEAFGLVSEYLDADDSLAKTCVERARGNPLFLEQLVRSASESAEGSVPGTVQSVVQARLDTLAPADKEALQAASVLGQRFALEPLRHLTAKANYAVDRLLAHHLVRPEGEGYLFVHALVQEGVYALLLKDRRCDLHRTAARWYATKDSVLYAEHLEKADDAQAPIAYHAAAGDQVALYRYETALRLCERGLGLAPEPAERFELTRQRGQILLHLGSITEAIETFTEALDGALDDTGRCLARIGLASGMRIAERFQEALEVLDGAQMAAASRGLTRELAQIHHLRGNLLFPLGDLDGCLEQHEHARRRAAEVGSAEDEAAALGGLGDAYYATGRMRTAHRHFSQCVAICRDKGFGRIEVANLGMAGVTRYYLNDLDGALGMALEAVEAAAAVGHVRAEINARNCAIHPLLEAVELDRAQEMAEGALELARKLGAKGFEGGGLTYLAKVHRLSGRRAKALELALNAVKVARGVPETFLKPRFLAEIALCTPDQAAQDSAIREGKAILEAGCIGHNYFYFYRDAMELMLDRGAWDDVEECAAALEAYTRPEPLPWSDFYIARGRALAALGRGRRDAELRAALERLADEARGAGMRLALPRIEEAILATS